MKTLKYLSALAIALITTGAANAQMTSSSAMSAPNWKIGIGIEPAVATGNLYKTTSIGLAGTLRLQYNTGGILSFMVTSGYDNFFLAKSTTTTTQIGSVTYDTPGHSQGVIPVKAGFKLFFIHNVYISGEGGVGFETQYAENKKLLLAPGLGYAHGPWDVSALYENFSGDNNQYGLAGIRVAYAFGL